MQTCILCHFETELDDVVVAFVVGGCVCLGCYGRETGSSRPMPRTLWRQVAASLIERKPA
jgi:hypothetical protein